MPFAREPGAPAQVAIPDDVLGRARTLATPGDRHLLGIAGPPGSGKSTLAQELACRLGPEAVYVPMDGFHLASCELERLGRQERKGAPDTFDAGGYAALLRRLRHPVESVVYAPEFRREIEEPVAGAIAVPATVPLVLTEGNYLLLDDPAWRPVRELLDEVWYLDADEAARRDWLIRRHIAHGKEPAAAQAWVDASDQANAEAIAATRDLADVHVQISAEYPGVVFGPSSRGGA